MKRSLICLAVEKYSVLILLVVFCSKANSQHQYRGIVADSITMRNMTGVYIIAKKSRKAAASAKDGTFIITAGPTDTLVFKMLGYKQKILPLLMQEEDLFVLMNEDVVELKEVVIRGWRLYPHKVQDITLEKPVVRPLFNNKRDMPPGPYPPLSMLTFFTLTLSPFDYCWSLERERRKLKSVIIEQNKQQTYHQIITTPAVKEIMTKDHHISDSTYYRLLAQFNIEETSVQRLTDPDVIMIALHLFIEKKTGKKN